MDELVSVIMPTYNRGYIIKMAINSILNQTYKNFEFIIIDDCSTDNTNEIVSEYKDKRIKYIKLEKNSGANYARNVGLQNANGKYITFQDSDDYSYPNRIEKEVESLKSTDSDVVFCSFNKVDKKKKTCIPDKYISSNDLHQLLLYKNVITTQVILGKREVFDTVRFDESLPRFQDWDLAIRMSKIFNFYHLNEVLLDLYVQGDSVTNNYKKGIDGLSIIYAKYSSEMNNKQKSRLLIRRGVFKSLSKLDASDDFKMSLKLHISLKNLCIHILYKLRLLNHIYKYIK